MFIRLSGIRVDAFQTALPLPDSYEEVIFTGGFRIDDVNLQKRELTDADIIATTTEGVWNNTYSVILAHFENTLSAGNYNTPITEWVVKRKLHSGSTYETIANISYTLISNYYYDNTARNLVNYDYTVHLLSNNTESLGTGGSAQLSFFGWSLSDTAATPITTYLFDLENTTNDIITNEDKRVYDNYTEYPAFRFGNRSYEASTLSTMPYSFTSGSVVIVDSTILDALRTFINNKEPKILRNSAGQIWEVITTDFSIKYIDQIPDQPYKVQFNWTQIGSGA
jgi:hypothetical protein